MAGARDIYYLYDLEGSACRHPVLVRAQRREYSNASQPDDDAANAAVEHVRDRALKRYLQQHACTAQHSVKLEGEMQATPTGEALFAAAGCESLAVCVADTRYGWPWVVLGAHASEAEFIAALTEDEDLAAFLPLSNVRQLHAAFVVAEELLDLGPIRD